jgi:thiamine-monophosphate kinase
MESEFLSWLRSRLRPYPHLVLGPGDDAALLRLGANCVVTVDMLSDGVDFELERIDPHRAGRKCLAVNLSDMAAMAARPLAAVIGLTLPRAGALDLAIALYEGLLPLAEKYGVAIAGGDLNTWDHPLCVSVTVLGEAGPRGPLRRDGAQVGDWLLVTGSLGGSLLGRHLDFEPRVAEAMLLHERYELHAGMDISDGLSLDLSRLADASGVGAALRLDDIPIAPAAEQISRQLADGSTPLERALGDGEDFELLLAASPDEAQRLLADQPLLAGHGVRLSAIGEVIADRGLWGDDRHGRRPLEPRGFQHRASPAFPSPQPSPQGGEGA